MPQAIIAQEPGPPQVLQIHETKIPEPGPTQVLVKVTATGVNYIEIYQRSGIYPVEFPFTPGSEFSGIVEKVGSKVTSYSPGDRVATAEGVAGYANYALVDSEAILEVPEDLDLDLAAALPLQGMTAHYLAHSIVPIEPARTALVHAGAGGVGLLLTQILKKQGITVFTTVSTEAKAELSKEAGAEKVFSYEDFAEQTLAATEGKGVDVVFDGVGKNTFEGSLKAVKTRGTVVMFGGASGQVPPFNLQELNKAGSVTLARPSLAHFLLTPEERRWRSQDMFTAAAAGELTVRIGARYPLADAALAHQDLESRTTTGKLLLHS